MTICYLRVGSDYLDDAYKASSIIKAACEAHYSKEAA